MPIMVLRLGAKLLGPKMLTIRSGCPALEARSKGPGPNGLTDKWETTVHEIAGGQQDTRRVNPRKSTIDL